MEENNAVETHNETPPPESYNVVGVRFRSCGKVYTFDVNDLDLSPGAKVVVDSEMGVSIGNVATPKYITGRKGEPLKKILRIADENDFETIRKNRDMEDEAKAFCVEKVNEMKLPMKIVTSETTLDKKRLTFYFTADGRIDFRELVRDLAAKFKTRIEMRQIGVRDEVKLLGGFGVCGRETCCSLFLTSFAPITIRMAKEQSLSINQSKLSGVCGRLMCCLGYEYREGMSAEDIPQRRRRPKVQVTEEGSADSLQLTDSDAISAEKSQQQRACSCPRRAAADKPPSEVQEDKQQEKSTGEKRKFRHDHGRRRHRKSAKPSHGGTQAGKPEPAPAAAGAANSSAENTEAKKKSSKRRRNFWKKKKSKTNGPEANK